MTSARGGANTEELIRQVQQGSAQLTTDQAITMAGELYSTGRYKQAANVCRQIIGHDHAMADAHNILGVSLNAMGQVKDGVAAIKRAIKLAPRVSAYHANLGEVQRLRGELGEATVALMEAVKLDPRNAQAHNNLGIVHYERKDYEAAVASYRQAIDLAPLFAEAHNNLGNSLRMTRDTAGAQHAYETALAVRDGYAEAYNNLGTLLGEQGKIEQAEHALKKAIQLNPRYVDAHHNLATILHGENRDVDALRSMADVLAFDPANEKCLLLTARIQMRRGSQEAAEQACRLVLQSNPDSSEAYATLGMLMHEDDRFDEAIALLETALRKNPADAEARNFYGVALKSVGRLDEAREQILQGLAANERMFGAYANLNDLVNFAENETLFSKVETLLEEATERGSQGRLPLHYAYAKGLEDRGDHARALEHYIAGGQLKRATLTYVEDDTRAFFDEIKQVFCKDAFENRRFAGNQTEGLVFIVGMPRSGSTLIEQIISAHPDVFGAGEIKYFSRALHALRDRFPSLSRYPQIFSEMNPTQFDMLAKTYASSILPTGRACKVVTDKLLTNFFFVGLIHLLFPKAKIINARRNPIDNCLSAFTKLFKDDMPHSYDLGEIGRYYIHYEALMEHWREVLPEGVMTTMVYEDVVDDVDGAARQLIEFVGLPWSDQCLEFYKSSRPVKTASVAQVRKPIYRSALGRWERYGPGLQPLLDGLGLHRNA